MVKKLIILIRGRSKERLGKKFEYSEPSGCEIINKIIILFILFYLNPLPLI
jgi:hypothetical protein